MNQRPLLNTIGTYWEGALKAAFNVALFGVIVQEQQIDFVKEIVSKIREAEIDSLSVSRIQKEEMKHQWKQDIEVYTQGIKDELRREGRLR